MVNGNRLYRKGSHCTACDEPPGAVANRIQSASEANGSSETRSRRRGDQRVHLDRRLPAVAGQGTGGTPRPGGRRSRPGSAANRSRRHASATRAPPTCCPSATTEVAVVRIGDSCRFTYPPVDRVTVTTRSPSRPGHRGLPCRPEQHPLLSLGAAEPERSRRPLTEGVVRIRLRQEVRDRQSRGEVAAVDLQRDLLLATHDRPGGEQRRLVERRPAVQHQRIRRRLDRRQSGQDP